MGQDDDSYIDIHVWARDRHLFIYKDHMAFIYMLVIILIYTSTILVISYLHGSLKDLGKDQIV